VKAWCWFFATFLSRETLCGSLKDDTTDNKNDIEESNLLYHIDHITIGNSTFYFWNNKYNGEFEI